MMHRVKSILTISLLLLPAAAWADVYQLNGPPDVDIDPLSVTNYTTMTGTPAAIVDALGTGCYNSCAILPTLVFSADANGFSISGPTVADPSADVVYLSGTIVPGSYLNYPPGSIEVGEIFDIQIDNTAQWSALEQAWAGPSDTQSASSFGAEVVMDIHFDTGNTGYAFADMTPVAPTPEPAALALLSAGLTAGLLRKRSAVKRK